MASRYQPKSLIHGRLSYVLAASYIDQTVYRKNVSCAEAIFSTLEIVSNYCKKGDRMYMCFYDLQRAFDSVQYQSNLYVDPKCMVRIVINIYN